MTTPPADIKDGQDLVLATYDALATSPQWERSLLVIVYDEHGGFFDHVPPPQAVDDDPQTFGHYGVRVPAIIVSPWVESRSVSKTLFDHTSIIKTILLRFCPDALRDVIERRSRLGKMHIGQPQYPGTRVAHANHLGELLTRGTPRPAPQRDTLILDAAARATEQAKNDDAADQARPTDHEPTELQRRIMAATRELTKRGHPTNAP